MLLVRGGLTALQLCVGAMTFDPLYFVGGFASPDTLEINTIIYILLNERLLSYVKRIT